MTKDLLRQMIREMVKEEVRVAIPEVLTEIFSSKSEATPQKPKLPTVQQTQSTPTVAPKKEFKKYTSNELLNKALNETVGGVPREGDLVASGMTSTPSIMDHVDQAPPVVAQALTKDYSALMKAIDKKRRGGVSSNGVQMM